MKRFEIHKDAIFGRTEDRRVSVHVLSEFRFCPRAAILALESGPDNGDEEPVLGPRLDRCLDFDEARFAESLDAEFGDLGQWLTFAAPATLLIFIVWRVHSPLGGLVASLPLCYCLLKAYEVVLAIISIIRARNRQRNAVAISVETNPTKIEEVNWWSLRNAGFDCLLPKDPYECPDKRLIGRPWRILTKGTTLRVPVVRKHHGEHTYRPQHLLRIAAYCHLIKACEGADSPFGILLFAGTDQCLIVPARLGEEDFARQLPRVREFLDTTEKGEFQPTAPTDGRCSGCPWGKPRQFREHQSATVLDGSRLAANLFRGGRASYHSHCGDRFAWFPPHRDAVVLRSRSET